MTDARTHYDVLGIARDASKDDIRAAYRERLDAAQAEQAKAREGKRPNEQAIASARADEAEIRAAWQVLSDPYQRGRYDALNLPPDGEVATSPPSTNGEVDTTGVPAVLDDADADDTPAPKGRQSRRAQLDAMRPPVFTDDGTQLELAPTGRRATGDAIDLLVMLLLWGAATGIAVALDLSTDTISTVSYAVFFGVVMVYFLLPIVIRGQSLGKRFTHTMLVDRATGHLPTANRTMLHYLPAIIAVLVLNPLGPGGAIGLMIGLSFMLTRDGLSLGDKLAKTVVVIARYRPVRVR